MDDLGGWIALAGLGAFHGLNPGMGWLFAVALGLQQQSRAAVWQALPPIALGHALSIGMMVALMLGLRATLPEAQLRWIAALAIGGFALFRIWRKKHLTWVGMQVGFRDLTLWSFLMASAHGAGLMLAPLLLGDNPLCGAGDSANVLGGGVATVAVHTVAHLAIAATLACVVYEVVGLRILRQAWFNIDRVWIGSLLITAGIVATG
jgi:hypothetical protein